jgi:tetratricopeptide (TPR) repeat protein
MINLIKKLFFICLLIALNNSVFATSSSTFLISQLAFKNYDYPATLLNFNADKIKLSQDQLLDKAIAAIITEDITLAKDIANKILEKNKNNQEAYIIKISSLFLDKKFNQIKELRDKLDQPNELLDFIFFTNNSLKDGSTISRALVEIVASSFSNNEQRRLNYNFLLFYTSLAKLIDPKNERAIIIKAELFDQVGQFEVARDIFEKISKQSPYYLDAQSSLAINYLYNSSYEDAENKILSILQNNNNNYAVKKILGDFYRYNKKYDLALSIYNQMIEENRGDIWNIFYMRGICFEQLGDWDLAEKDFLKSLEIKPDSPNVLNYLAYGWVEREMKLDRSLQMLEEAYEANPESFYIIDSLAWAHFKKNNLSEAARLMEMVIDIAPGEAISLDHLGDIYYAMNRKREAIHFWQQALELAEPDDEIEENVKIKLEKFNG